MEGKQVRTVRIENEIDIEASQERVFAAMTTEQGAWYPYNYGQERLKQIVWEERIGGLVYEDWGDGLGTLYGQVWYWDKPRTACMRGYLRGGVTLESWITVEPTDSGSVLKHSMVCFGELSDDDVKGIKFHGDLAGVEAALKSYVTK